MIQSQATKLIPLVLGTVSTSATASASFDASGWSYGMIEVGINKPTAATAAVTLTALAIQEADGTSYAAITGLTGTTNTTAAAGEFVIPPTVTTDTNVIRLGINNTGRKKNFRVIYQGVTGGATLAITARMSNGEEAPVSATEQGVLTAVNV
jgi:hypothetical protein